MLQGYVGVPLEIKGDEKSRSSYTVVKGSMARRTSQNVAKSKGS